jgi:four helix bundle protein
MAKIERFEDIEVWKLSRQLVKDIYRMTQRPSMSKDWGIRDQIQRAAVSIMSNIAEGYERGSNKEFVQFLFIARASAGEVRSLLYVGLDQDYIDKETFDDLAGKVTVISRQLKGFVEYLRGTNFKRR